MYAISHGISQLHRRTKKQNFFRSRHEIMINVDVGQSDRIQDLAWKLAKAKMEATVLHSHDADLVAAARAETRFYRSIFCRGLHQICAGDVRTSPLCYRLKSCPCRL